MYVCVRLQKVNHRGKFSDAFKKEHKTAPDYVPWMAGLVKTAPQTTQATAGAAASTDAAAATTAAANAAASSKQSRKMYA